MILSWMMAQVDSGTLLPETMGVLDVFQKGGPLMLLILGCSVFAVGTFIERVVFYHRCHLRVTEFLVGIVQLLRRQRFLEALERCDEGYGPVAKVVQKAILSRNLPAPDLREVVRETAQLQVPQLEANLPLLATIGYVSPLIGLLGTVTGMIDAFLQINLKSGAAGVGDLAGGIWTALITTAAGLMVAIPCYVAYNYLVTRSQGLIQDMERAGIEVIHALLDPPLPDTLEVKGVEDKPSAEKPAESKEKNDGKK